MTAAFRGRVEARALVLAAALLGEAEARARVLELWRPGTTVRLLPDGDWLLLFAEPMSLRAEHAPGLPLAAGPTGRIEVPRAGETRTYDTDALPEIDPAQWLDLDDYAVHALSPLEPPEPAPAVVLPPPAPAAAPDLRATAGVGETSASAQRLRAGMTTPADDRHEPVDGLLVQLALRSPLAGWLRGRHERYLQQLTRQFEDRSWDRALRDAVALAGSGAGGRTTLRLPGHRTGPLRPANSVTSGGGVIQYGSSSYGHLQRLYREAAESLEKEGRIQEAAFVLADLLGLPEDAAALLERHGRIRAAAELADGRGLDPALVVRLWWRAGQRERALEVARARGAFAAAIDRLGPLDQRDALRLRLAWSADRYAAGDHLGAVEAAWPEPELRPGAVSLARQGLDSEAPGRPALLAYALARRPDPAHLDEARALLAITHPDEADWRAQRVFARTLCVTEPETPGLKRELSSAALRAVLRGARHETDKAARAQLVKSLRKHADPLLGADLAQLPHLGERPTLHLSAESEPGRLPVEDAVALSPNALLTAHGELGVRLLGRDGRVRARWDVPAHRLVVADHGGTALLVAEHADVRDIWRLDLSTRRVRRWTALRVRELASSYDGSLLTVVDEDGIAFVETRSEQPRALWRELDRDHRVERLERTGDSLTAVVLAPSAVPGRATTREVWRWELPSVTLRSRSPLRDPRLPADTVDVLYDGDVTAAVVAAENSRTVRLDEPPGGRRWASVTFPGGAGLRLRAFGELVTLHDASGRIVVLDAERRALVANLRTRLG
ncbi:bpX6 domain-containing protein [Streptomyces sp. NPDC020681]|uniref:bpX6 domain-containing protein n=1 Tax=Streptomyces sp. NPDC020681 TaxID=3365083 RepID=UPI0037BCE979